MITVGNGDRTVAERFTFDALVSPIGRETFAREYQGTREWIHHGDSHRFDSLLSWHMLNKLIRDQRPAGPRFRLMRDGARLPEETYQRNVPTLRGPLRQLDPARLLAELRQGATLVWDAIDQCHPPARAMKQEIERALGTFAFVNLYASWGNASGTNDHWDDHDIFVLQLIGRKSWRVHPATRPWPLPDDAPGTSPATYANEVTLVPGSVLYLPRGWWHLATPVDEPSLHLTIGVLRPTNADFLAWLLDIARESELVRRDFPLSMDGEAREAHAVALRAVLDEWLHAENLDLFAQMHDATHYLDPRPTLQAVGDPRPETWDPDSYACLLSTRARVEERSTDVVLVVAGSEFRAPTQAGPLLRALVDGRTVRLAILLEHVPSDLVAKLVEVGVLAIE
jgi:ribosomal protein L16 Arg81 hydroxylase